MTSGVRKPNDTPDRTASASSGVRAPFDGRSSMGAMRFRMDELEAQLEALEALHPLIPDTKAQLQELQELASRVSAEVETVRAQRDAIRHAVEAASRADTVANQVESLGERQREQAETYREMEESLMSLQSVVAAHVDEIRDSRQTFEAHDEATLAEIASLRKAVDEGLKQVEASREAADAIATRMGEMIDGIGDLERRVENLDDSRGVVTLVRSEVEELSARVIAIAGEAKGFADLEQRLADANRLHADIVERSDQLASRQEELEDGSREARGHLADIRKHAGASTENAEAAAAAVVTIMQDVDAATEGLARLDACLLDFESVRGSVAELRRQADELTDRMQRTMGEGGRLAAFESRLAQLEKVETTLQERTDEITRRHGELDEGANATGALLDTVRSDVRDTVAETERAAGSAQQIGEHLDGLTETTADLESRLRDLHGLRDQLADVDDQAGQLAQRLEALRDGSGSITALERRLGELRALQTDVLDQWDVFAERQADYTTQAEAAQERLRGLEGDVDRTTDRVAAADQTIDSVDERLDRFEKSIATWEEKLRQLTESEQALTDVRHEADDLAARLAAIGDDCEEVRQQAAKLRRFSKDVDRIGGVVKGVERRLDEVEEARVELDALKRERGALERTSESNRELLVEAQSAHTAIAEMREEQSATEAWFAELTESLATLRRREEELDGLAPTLDVVRDEAERVATSLAAIEERKDQITELDRRLRELESLGHRLEHGAAAPPPDPRVTDVAGETRWHFDANVAVDRSTWEFGLQMRLAGRWKRGVAIWFGPLRAFIGWERRAGWHDPIDPPSAGDLETTPEQVDRERISLTLE